MRIEHLQLENFGIYTHQRFDFNAAPLVLIYGANESGKTTALNGIRQAIFGFRTRTPYLTGATMQAEVTMRMDDDSRLEFVRRKGRPDDVRGTWQTATVGEAEVRKLLANMDLESYEHLFGFSQEELRKGQDTLKSARLTEALAGGSLGGIHALERLRAELNDSLGELYKPRGSTSKINRKLLQIRKSRESLTQSEVTPSQVAELRRQAERAQQQSEQHRAQIVVEHRRRAELQQRLAALPDYQRRRALQAQLDEIDFPADVDAALIAQWTDLGEQRRTLTRQLEQESKELQQDTSEVELLGGECSLFAVETDIESLGHQAQDIAGLRQRLKELQHQQTETQAVCQEIETNLQLPTVTDELLAFEVSVPTRHRLQQVAEQHRAVTTECTEVVARLSAANESLRGVRDRTDSDGELPENLADLRSLLDRLESVATQLQQQARSLEQNCQAEDFRELTKRLHAALQPGNQLAEHWAVPTQEQLTEIDGQRQRVLRELDQMDAERDRLDKELQLLSQEPGQQNEGAAADSPVASGASALLEQIERIAKQRDAILAHWLDELSQPLIAASITVEQQQERLSELQRIAAAGDSAQTQLMEVADSVARDRQRLKQMDELRERQQKLLKSLQSQRETESELTAALKQLWQHVPCRADWLERLSLTTYISWLQDYQLWQRQRQQQQQARRELHLARATARAIRGQLLDLWPHHIREEFATAMLGDQLQRWEASRQQAQHQKSQEKALRNSIAELSRQQSELEQRRQSLFAEYQAWLDTVPFQVAWPIEQVVRLLDLLDHLRREHRAEQRAQRQLDEVRQTLEQFEQSVAKISSQLEEAGGPAAEVRAMNWLRTLHTQRDERSQRIRLVSRIEHRQRRVQELSERLRSLDQRLAAVCAATGAADSATAAGIMDRVVQADRVRSELRQLTASLTAYCPDRPLDVFLEELDGSDAPTMELDLQECSQKLEQLDGQRQQADEQTGAIQQQLAQLAQSHEAGRRLQALHHQRGELAELADQWVLERLAQELLKRSVERFTQENEPELLQLSRRYLAQLTGERYVSLEHDQSSKGQFVVRNASGEAFTPDRLSTGTREQLYLAIRMAFITHHAQEHEPLPVIMDDCFVNFDDQRAAHALEAIRNWDARTQTILLSCHSRMVHLLARQAPDTPLVLLDGGSCDTVGQFASELQTL